VEHTDYRIGRMPGEPCGAPCVACDAAYRADRAAELMSLAYARIDRRAHGTDRHLVSQAFALAANLYAIASGSATRWVVAR
jgi:hypothetical protein